MGFGVWGLEELTCKGILLGYARSPNPIKASISEQPCPLLTGLLHANLEAPRTWTLRSRVTLNGEGWPRPGFGQASESAHFQWCRAETEANHARQGKIEEPPLRAMRWESLCEDECLAELGRGRSEQVRTVRTKLYENAMNRRVHHTQASEKPSGRRLQNAGDSGVESCFSVDPECPHVSTSLHPLIPRVLHSHPFNM